MGFFDDVSDTVGDVVDDAKEAVDDVTDGAGDVADEVSDGDVGGAIDEAQDTVEDVASGDQDTGSNDTSNDNFSSPEPSGGSSSSGGGSDDGGISIDTGGSSGGDDDYDGGSSSGGGSSDPDPDPSGSSSGGSSTTSPKQTVKDKVSNQDNIGPQGPQNKSPQGASGLPENVSGEIDRVKGRIQDLKQGMKDGTWAAYVPDKIEQKKDYLDRLQRRDPNETVDRTGNVIVDGEGNTLGSGNTWAEAEYDARVNSEGNPDFNKASESAIADVAEERAQEAQERFRRSSQEIEDAKKKIQNDQATNYLVNPENLPQEDLSQLGISQDAQGQVEVSENNLIEYYDQQLNEVRNRIRDAEEQENKFANFGQNRKNKKRKNGQDVSSATAFGVSGDVPVGLESALADGRLTESEYKDYLENQAQQGDIQAELQLAQLNSDTVARDTTEPGIPAKVDNFLARQAREGSRGLSESIEKSKRANRQSDNIFNPAELASRTVAGLENIGSEAVEALPNIESEREFDSLTEQQLYDNRGQRTLTTAELTANNPQEIELDNGETITVGGEQPDYSPEVQVDVEPGGQFDPWSVENRNQAYDRAKELQGKVGGTLAGTTLAADDLAKTVGGSVPRWVTSNLAEDSQQVAPDVTPSSVIDFGGAQVQAIEEDPVAYASGAGLSYGIGKVSSSAYRGAKSAAGKSSVDVDTNLQATKNNLRSRADGDSATGEGFSEVKTTVTQSRLIRPDKTREYTTNINTPGIQAFDRSGNLYGRAVTRNADGDVVNTENFVSSSVRRAPDDIEGRVGEASDVGTKLEIEGGPTRYLDSDSVIAQVEKGSDYTDIYRQSARRDSDADTDLTRSRTRIERQRDSDADSDSGGAGNTNTGGGSSGGVPAGSGRVELETRQADDTGSGDLQGTPGALNNDVVDEVASYSARQADSTGSGGSGAGVVGAASFRPGSTGQASGVDPDGVQVVTSSPGRATFGNAGPEDTSGQVVGLGGRPNAAGGPPVNPGRGNSGRGNGVGGGIGALSTQSASAIGSSDNLQQESTGPQFGPGEGVARLTANQGAVVNFNEREQSLNQDEFSSNVVGLGASFRNLPGNRDEEDNRQRKSRQKGKGKGKGRGGPGRAGPTSLQQQNQPEGAQRQQGPPDDAPGVASGIDLKGDQAPSTDVPGAALGLIENEQSPQRETGRTVQNKPGVGRRSKQEVVPQGLTDTLQAPGQAQGFAQFQGFEQAQTPVQDQPQDGGSVPPNAFGVPGFPGRPRVPRGDDEERDRRSQGGGRRDLYGYGQRSNPIASGTELLFGGQRRQTQKDDRKNEEDVNDVFRL